LPLQLENSLKIVGTMVLGWAVATSALAAPLLPFGVSVYEHSPNTVLTVTNALLSYNTDPSLNYGYGVYNGSGTVQTYTLTFPLSTSGVVVPLSINLAPGTYDATVSLGVTLTDGGGDGATFSQVGTTPFETGVLNYNTTSQVNVIGIGTGPLTIAPGASNPSQTFTFSPVDDPNFQLTTQGSTMDITTTFELSPGDSASFSGSFKINAVPEPASLSFGLLAAGAMGALLVLRRRSAQA
jgi:hypothetical protein